MGYGNFFFCHLHLWCEHGYLPVVIVGLVGNLISTAVFLLSPHYKEKPLTKTLITLAIVDFLYLVTATALKGSVSMLL